MTIEPAVRGAQPGWLWLFASGALATALGVFGLAITPVLTIAAVAVLGVVLAGAALYQLASVVRARGWRRVSTRLAYAGAYAVGAVAMIGSPATAAAGLTLMIAAGLLVIGFRALLAGLAGRDQPAPAARWVLAAVSILSGTLLLATWPVSSVWTIGLIVAVFLLTSGWRKLVAAMRLRRRDARAADAGAALIA